MSTHIPSLPVLAKATEVLARKAGELIHEVYGQDSFGVETKGDKSPLTLADKRSHECLAAGLQVLTPDVLVVSEEGGALPYAERSGQAFIWIVDPLDGTKEFIKRNGEFCVCIALVEAGKPILGVIHAPVTRKSYVAWRGGGSHLVEEDGAFQPLPSLTPIPPQARGLRFSVSRSHLNDTTRDYLSLFQEPATVAGGSALKFCQLADGTIDVYPRHAPTMEWDTAAGQLIVEEVGGQVLVATTGQPMTYNRENQVNPFFVAARPAHGDFPLLPVSNAV